jgi:hypothetical protein
MAAQSAPQRDNPWLKWSVPGKTLRIRALRDGTTVAHERARIEDRGEVRPGLLRVRTLTTVAGGPIDQIRAMKHRKDMWVPVITVDDVPVAVGFGVVTLPLGPGPHVVAVQTQDSKDDCCSAMVVDGAQGANLVYVAPHLPHGAGLDDISQHGRLGLPGVMPERWPDYRYMRWFHYAVLAFLVTAFATGGIASVLWNQAMSGPVGGWGVAAAVGALAPAILIGFWVGRRVKRKRARIVAEVAAQSAAMLDFAPVRVATQDEPVWHCAGSGEGLTPERPGYGLVVVRQELRQWPDPLPQEPMFKPLPHPEAATPAPRVQIGRRSVPQGWGTWAVEVPAGRHLAGAVLNGANGSAEVAVTAGGRTEIVVAVRTEHRWDGTGADATLKASVPELTVTAR